MENDEVLLHCKQRKNWIKEMSLYWFVFRKERKVMKMEGPKPGKVEMTLELRHMSYTRHRALYRYT
jgi:hypothetical protein